MLLKKKLILNLCHLLDPRNSTCLFFRENFRQNFFMLCISNTLQLSFFGCIIAQISEVNIFLNSEMLQNSTNPGFWNAEGRSCIWRIPLTSIRWMIPKIYRLDILSFFFGIITFIHNKLRSTREMYTTSKAQGPDTKPWTSGPTKVKHDKPNRRSQK